MRDFLIAAAAIFVASAASAAEPVKTSAGWTVTSAADDKKFISPTCTLSSPVSDTKTRLQLINAFNKSAPLPTRGSALLIVTVPDVLSKERRASLKGTEIAIPGQADWKDRTVAWRAGKEGGTIRLSIDPKIDAALKPFVRGKELTVRIPVEGGEAKSYSVPLKGSAEAIFAYEKCLAEVVWKTSLPAAAAPNDEE
ncbi:hypothetical protein QBK99_01330 [Corticibacterium sp. UT-5YL-CI-8]|nr:hypothetical protein [Tianweitania sp. UT-5YL-CI-8]